MSGALFEFQRHDLEDILSLSEIALNCESMDDLQQEILFKIQQTVGAESSVYFDVVHTSLGWQFVNGISYGVPDKAPKTWCDHYQTIDPFTINLLNHLESGDKRIITTADTINPSDYVRMEFYCDFLRPQSIYHMMVVGLPSDSKPVGLIGLHRTSGAPAFSPRDVSKVDAMVPYISAAVRKIKLSEMASERQAIIKALAGDLHHNGVLVLDKDLFPTFLDDHAREVLKAPAHQGHEIIRTINDFLPPQLVRCCEELRQKANSSCTGKIEHHADFTIEHEAKKISGSVCAYKTQARGLCFLICFKAQAGDLIKPGTLQKFNLTRREIDIAHLISAGMTNPEIADKLFISVRTVQNHLRSIYRKVQVHNRTSLLSRLMQ